MSDYTLEKYGPDWLVYRDDECVPVRSFRRKADAVRWIAAQKRDDQ